MKTLVEVITRTLVEVSLDETRFTPEWLDSFNAKHFVIADGLPGHARYLAELKASGAIEDDDQLGPYGDLRGAGIRLIETDREVSTSVISEVVA